MSQELKLLTFGVFDLFHAGHVHFLRQIGRYGLVYVAVADDASVRSLKGKDRPIYPLDQRIDLLDACRPVEKVIPLAFGNDPAAAFRGLIESTEFDIYIRSQNDHASVYEVLREKSIPQLWIESRVEVSTARILEKVRGKKTERDPPRHGYPYGGQKGGSL